MNGKIANGNSCESPLVATGAISCNTGYACKGTVGSRTCQPALCSDGIDNDSDGKTDYPFDPGCDSPADDTEANLATAPVCADGVDNEPDGQTDFPADWGCAAATGETDATSAITTKTTTSTTVGKSNDSMPSCSSSNAPDIAYGFLIPVQVSTLQVDTIGSGFDTIVTVRDVTCATVLGCDDDGGGNLTSKVTLTNLAPGGYAVVVDGYSANSGAVTLNIHGTAVVGAPCEAPLLPPAGVAMFAGGANAVLSCPTSCSAATHKCL
jgi:hypothetical protein